MNSLYVKFFQTLCCSKTPAKTEPPESTSQELHRQRAHISMANSDVEILAVPFLSAAISFVVHSTIGFAYIPSKKLRVQ